MGSLFKARDLWTVKLNQDEEVDRGCMALGNVDNDSSGQDKIIVGSFQGVLRVFNPKNKGFRPDDLLLEQQLEAPVLSILTGKFISNSTNVAICVLHPRKVVVYGVVRTGSSAADGGDPLARHYSLSKQYEHLLERTAYNMISGPFGNNTLGKDFFCVQSMDGQLSFFEQEKLVFGRFLPSTTFLVPGHMCYNAKADAFYINTSTYDIECYRYSTFAMSSASETKDSKEATGRRLTPDWSTNIGEDTVDIRAAKVTRSLAQSQADIIVLGERTLYFLKETGEIRFQKRLDFFPTYLCPYVCKDNKYCNLVVGAHSGTLLVYNDTSLSWAAKLPSIPLAVGVASMCKIDGMIVVLGDDNSVSVNYLGTDPATQPVQLLESKELDYEEMDEEHRRLQVIIRQAVNTGKSEPKDQVQISYELPPGLDSHGHSFEGQHHVTHAGGRSVTAKIFLAYGGMEDVENLILTINCPVPITVHGETSVHIPLMTAAPRPTVIPITFILSAESDKLTPTSLLVEIIGAYTLGSGEPLTCRCQFILPLSLVSSITPPIKAAAYKITLDTNRMPPPLTVLFEDVTNGSSEATPNALSILYSNGHDGTILVSRNAGRYRIQSSSFDSLWILSSELVRRLKAHFTAASEPANQEAFKIEFTEAMPFNEYFATMDAHFGARQHLAASQQTLSERAHQFRSIQKRLLVRFKDRNPSPLFNLDYLFEDTFQQLIRIADEVEKQQIALLQASNALVCATHLILLLLRYQLGGHFTKDDFKTLQHHLSPIVMDSQSQGWEECIDAAMTHLLRTVLAKNVKESSSMPQPIVMPPETSKVRKHITLVCDRLAKGANLRDTKKSWEVTEKPTEGKKSEK
jgi:Bardet-Biedl syndrome 9 protein